MDEQEPIVPFRPWRTTARPDSEEQVSPRPAGVVAFDRKELTVILDVYGKQVAAGEWRDYALDFGRDRATFSIFRRASEQPLYRIVKDPALVRRQGQYAVIAQGGLIMKRGQELAQVLRVLLKTPNLARI